MPDEDANQTDRQHANDVPEGGLVMPRIEPLGSNLTQTDNETSLAAIKSAIANYVSPPKRNVSNIVRTLFPTIDQARRKRPPVPWAAIAEIVGQHGIAATPDAVRIAYGRLRKLQATPGMAKRMSMLPSPADLSPRHAPPSMPATSRARDHPIKVSPHDKQPNIARRVK